MSDPPLLREFPFFVGVDDATLQRLAAEAKVETHGTGAVLFRQGERITAMSFVVRGFVKLTRTAASGDETLIGMRTDGASLNEAPFRAGETHHYSAETVGPATALKIPAGRFARLMADNPSLALAALADAKRTVAELTGEIESLKASSAEHRLVRFLISFCPPEEDHCRFRLPYDKRLVAARLGVTQETLSRSFARLRAYGVRTEARGIGIESVARLRAQFEEKAREHRASGRHAGSDARGSS
jgi:CRP/FNR family transcriptional regulator, dissimilatory nitrate respiration regulator